MIINHKQYDLFGEVIFEKIRIQMPFKIPNPTSEDACFMYMLDGQIDFRTENEFIKIPDNEAVLLKCGNYFSQLNYNKSRQHEIVLVHFRPEILKKIYINELPIIFQQINNQADEEINLSKINNDFLIQKYIEGLLFYFDNPSLVNQDIVILKLKEIILLLCQTRNVQKISVILSQLFSPKTYTFKQLIENNLFENYSIEQSAHMCNLSVSSFKREFAKQYHQTPASYIRAKKLEKAAELLRLSDSRITDIAFDCGFNDLSNFSNLFHEKYNCSPSVYRLNK